MYGGVGKTGSELADLIVQKSQTRFVYKKIKTA
jgi:hypothetical protein